MEPDTENGTEKYPSSRSDSIGSDEAFRDLVEPTSVDLLRNSIFRSISNKQTPAKVVDIRDRYRSRTRNKLDFTDITQADIDVKFLKKRCSSFESSINTANAENRSFQRQNSVPGSIFTNSNATNSLSDLSELMESSSFEKSGEFSDGEAMLEGSATGTLNQYLTESQEFTDSRQNSLRLAFSVGSNHSIFETCSTYDIMCSHEVNLVSKQESPITRDDLSTAVSLACSEKPSRGQAIQNLRNSFTFLSPDIGSSNSVPSVSSPDDQNALCDTFFPHVFNGEYVPPQNSPVPQTSSVVNRKRSVARDNDSKKEVPVNEDAVSTYSNTSNASGRKPSKRVRKRNRKSLSQGPYVYDCPKCGVSYTIPSKTMSDVACCLHCDLVTSVEPVFMKREKLTWNTCRIC